MNQDLRKSESPERKATVTLTLRDILLLKLGLELVNQDYTRGSALSLDIQSLKDKLAHEYWEDR